MDQRARILNEAIEQWETQTNITAHLVEADRETGVDFMLHFTYNGEDHVAYIELKRELRNHQLPEIEHLALNHRPLMVVADNIFPKIKEELRNADIAYLETSGNMFYKDKNLFLWLDGKKQVKREDEKLGRAFTKTGLKAVFQFLLRPEIVNATYRNIAEQTDINFGNINFIMTDLKEQGYLMKIDKDNQKLIRKRELLEKWMDAYEHKLKPSLLLGTFEFIHESDALNWKRIPLRNGRTWWGGEPGGDLLTNYLQPETFTLYTTETKNELLRNYRLRPTPKGNVKVYQQFWKIAETYENVAPLLLVYTDLMNTGDRRCMQTAEKLYNEQLQDQF